MHKIIFPRVVLFEGGKQGTTDLPGAGKGMIRSILIHALGEYYLPLKLMVLKYDRSEIFMT